MPKEEKKDRNDKMIEMFLNFKTQRYIGREFGITDATVSNIINRYLTKAQILDIRKERAFMTAKRYSENYIKKCKLLKK